MTGAYDWVRMPRLAGRRTRYGGWLGASAAFGRKTHPLKQTLLETRTSRTKNIETRHFLLALLDRERPDPAAELLHSLGVDRLQVRSRLQESSV